MAKRILQLILVLLLVVSTSKAQTHTYPALDTNNVFTGSNTFNGPFLLPSLTPGQCLTLTTGGLVTTTACGGSSVTLQSLMAPTLPTTTGVTFAATPNGGSLYTSAPSITLSGGTCSTSPIIVDFNNTGVISFQIVNAGVCTVVPAVSIGSDSTGSGAGFSLAFQGSTLEATPVGVPFQSTNSGFGQVILQNSPQINYPTVSGLTLLSGIIPAGINTTQCLPPFLQYSGGVRIIGSCGVTDTITLFPGEANSPQVTFATSTVAPDIETIYATNGDNSIGFNPTTIYGGQPMASGLNWYLNNDGLLIASGYRGGTGYTGAGSCVLSGGLQLSGGTDTCSTSLSSGIILLSVTNNGFWSAPPTAVISGTTGGTGAASSQLLSLAHVNTISGSLWQDVSANHLFHLSSLAKGSVGADWFTVGLSSLFIPAVKASSGSNCLHVDSAGNITNTGADCGTGSPGVASINGTTGAFTFSGGGVSCTGITCTFSGGSPSFSTITAGTNTTALLVGTSGSLGTTGTGTIASTSVNTTVTSANASYPILVGAAVSGQQTPATVSGFTINPSTGAVTTSGSIASTTDGVHAGLMSVVGNTTLPTLSTNSFGIFAPNSASFTSFGWQAPTATNGNAGLVHIAANVSGVSQMSVSQISVADMSATGTPSSTTFFRGDNTWSAVSGLPSSTAALQLPLYLTAGSSTATPTSFGVDATPLGGSLIDSNGSRNGCNGEIHLGDSITANTGTAVGSGFTFLLDAYTNCGPALGQGTTAVSGDGAADSIARSLNKINPGDTANPTVISMIGTNDVHNGTATANLVAFDQYLLGTDYWNGMSSSNKTLAGNTAFWTQAGTWNADTTFTFANGLNTTITGSTLTDSTCTVGPTGVIVVWAMAYTTSDGTWSLSVDGTTQTDSITGLQNISSQIQANAPGNVASPTAILARFPGITRGTHTCVITATLTTGTVGIAAIGFPPTIKYRGPTVLRGGVPFQNANANGAAVAIYNNRVQIDTLIADGDGIQDKFVNVQAYLDYNLDFTGTATQNCAASLSVGLHPNNCGHAHLYQAFADALKVGSIIPVNLPSPQSTTMWNWNPNNSLGTSSTLLYGPCFFASATGTSCETFLSGANLVNPIFPANTFFHAHVADGSGFTLGEAFCTTTTLPTTAANQITCPLYVLQGGLNATATNEATSGVNRSAVKINSTGRGWTGAAGGNDTYAFGTLYTSNGAAGDVWFDIQSVVQTVTGFHGLSFRNSGGFGMRYTMKDSTVLETGDFPYPGLSIKLGTAVLTPGTNVTSVASAAGFPTANNTRGMLTIVGGTATTGVIATVTFSAALSQAPMCHVVQQGGATILGLSAQAASTTAFTISSAVTVTGVTLTAYYECLW